jgi:hypothetical protein
MASATITKKAAEALNLGFRYHSPALGSTEAIQSGSISAPVGITVGTVQISGTEIFANVSAGTAGTDYTLVYTATTDQGQTFIDDYLVKVRA